MKLLLGKQNESIRKEAIHAIEAVLSEHKNGFSSEFWLEILSQVLIPSLNNIKLEIESGKEDTKNQSLQTLGSLVSTFNKFFIDFPSQNRKAKQKLLT